MSLEDEEHEGLVTLRRVEGPVASEIFLMAKAPPRPSSSPGGPSTRSADGTAEVAEHLYRALATRLDTEGAAWSHLVTERIFLQAEGDPWAAAEAGRAAGLASVGAPPRLDHARSALAQTPLDGDRALAIAVHAVVPKAGPSPTLTRFDVPVVCDCPGCAGSRLTGFRRMHGAETQFRAGGVLGRPGDAYGETFSAFEQADALLAEAGLAFGDVVRTWIHLREIDRDYDAFNRARRDFFEARGIAPPPASTGIGGGPVAPAHDLALGFLALRQASGLERAPMHTPTLNEAPRYGADFSRGMSVLDANKRALHVSGTASLDASGQSVHAGDVEAQVDRMLLNVTKLLQEQGADFGDIVSGWTYVKHPADLDRVRARCEAAGYGAFPHVFVAADVCRPELLCETELLAALPRERTRA